MTFVIHSRIGLALALLLLASCSKPLCPQKYADLTGATECTCAANPTGSVWGSEIYTTDSAICAAAVNAGAVPASGGTVSLKSAPGCLGYQGSSSNAVTSNSWGSYPSSFYFAGHGSGQCPAVDPHRCPATIGGFPNAAATNAFSCNCAAGAAGSVWGSGIYTTDSSICAAAVHAGEIPASGGPVALQRAPGCATYTGTAKNGITTTSYGKYDTSFFFPRHGDGKCEGAAAAPIAAAGVACPERFNAIPGASSGEHTCTCKANASGSVYGDAIYTTDSSMCAAALHAGAISSSGGNVTAKAAPGCPSYKGTVKNGVTTRSWGKYDASFYFPSHGTGKCG